LFDFILTRENWIAKVQLANDATQRPHVNGSSIFTTEDDLRRPVETALDIGVDPLSLETTTAKINDFNTALVFMLKEYILWFEITMNNGIPF
jgi:hypothetical protein